MTGNLQDVMLGHCGRCLLALASTKLNLLFVQGNHVLLFSALSVSSAHIAHNVGVFHYSNLSKAPGFLLQPALLSLFQQLLRSFLDPSVLQAGHLTRAQS